MDANTITQMISNFGFPIAVDIVLLYVLYQIFEKFIGEFNDMKNSIQMNTKELAELRTTLKEMGGKVKQ